jgi:hypothetical protein
LSKDVAVLLERSTSKTARCFSAAAARMMSTKRVDLASRHPVRAWCCCVNWR